MHRTLSSPLSRPARALSRSARRATAGLATVAVAGALLTGLGAGVAQAAVAPSGPPVGNFESATAVTGGVKVRGWAADADSASPLTVNVTVAGTTHRLTTSVSRPDVTRVFPQFRHTTGFEKVIPLPNGTHQVCVTAVNVGAGQNKVFACRTATVTAGTATTTTTTTTTTPTTTTSTPTTTTAPTARTLSWAPPALTNPITIAVSATNRAPRLAAGQDYIITMPTTPLQGHNGLILSGGRNIVLVGGEINISQAGSGNQLRGLYLKGQTGTVHIEGLRITGSTLAEGINLDERAGATVQLQNIRVDTVRGSLEGAHADVLQTWGGPKVLRIDGLTGYTNYQGFFLLPNQYGGTPPQLFDLRNVNLVGQTGSKYLFWRDAGTWPAKTQNVWASTSQVGAPRHQYLRGAWDGVLSGKPATGDIVPAGLAGARYVSPGYTR